MNIIEELYYGNLNPNEKRYDRDSQYAKALELLCKNEKILSLAANPGSWVMCLVKTFLLFSPALKISPIEESRNLAQLSRHFTECLTCAHVALSNTDGRSDPTLPANPLQGVRLVRGV